MVTQEHIECRVCRKTKHHWTLAEFLTDCQSDAQRRISLQFTPDKESQNRYLQLQIMFVLILMHWWKFSDLLHHLLLLSINILVENKFRRSVIL